MKPTNTKQTRLFNTDNLMKNLWLRLYRDFSSTCPQNLKKDRYADYTTVQSGSIPTYRTLERKSYWYAHKYYFKCAYQLDSLFKRYRFEHDLYSDVELVSLTLNKFIETQTRIRDSYKPTTRSLAVVNKAKQIVADVLGPYSSFEHAQSCSFGKRASVGLPRRVSYLDKRLLTLTGSQDHIEWFRYHLLWDKLLAQSSEFPPFVSKFEECDVLTMTAVPKNHKSLRLILANTVIGGFYSAGIGKMIEKRLLSVNLKLSKLQMRHRSIIKAYSKNLSHVTADLSSASDSFSDAHLQALLPKDWYDAIVYGRVEKVEFEGRELELNSIMLMGIGFTFPLQTLLFYALLEATRQLLKIGGTISVYGDDLIYPSKMHRYMKIILPELGFILNGDKTFSDIQFRESCGGDFYCGTDVRPFQPEGSHRLLNSREYQAFIYKVLNGLTARWSKDEINITYRFLLSEILRVSDIIYQVPCSFPEYSGIRTECPSSDFLVPFSRITRKGYLFRFKMLGLFPKDRIIENQYAYLWNTLRAKNHSDCEIPHEFDKCLYHRDDGKVIWIPDIHDALCISWKHLKHTKNNYRSVKGKRIPILTAVCPNKSFPFRIGCHTATSLEWT